MVLQTKFKVKIRKQKLEFHKQIVAISVTLHPSFMLNAFSATYLTLIWVGFLEVRSQVGQVKLPSCLKPVRITLETSNLARKYTPICSSRKYTFQCEGPLSFADRSIFCPKKYLYSKQQCENYVKGFLVLFPLFVRQKVTVAENITFADSVSGIRSLDCSKLAKNPENDNEVIICRHDVNVKFFLTLFCFSCQVQLVVQVSCQYRHWFWNYDNFLL